MASKLDKIKEEAQKLAIKGPVEKAIKAFEQLVSMEPAVLTHRQRLADLLIKAGRPDAARSELEVIGKNFSANGFYLKAIAIYTKLQGMFPGDIPIALTLAGLNEKHGLTANALAEYKRVYDCYEKNSETEEALGILEKMQAVDAHNINIRLKLAEAYFSAGKKDESYTSFSKLASLLQERGDSAAFAKLNARIQQLFPKKSEFMLEILSEQVASGNAASAVNGLQALLRTNPNDKRLWELIIEAYKQLEQPQKLKVAYQHFLKFFPDELPAKVGLILCLASEKNLKGALGLLESYELELIAGRYLDDLETIYRVLDEIDPINLPVLEGLRRVFEAGGKFDEVAALETKIKSLRNLSDEKSASRPQVQKETFVEPEYFAGQAPEEPEFGEVSFADVDTDISAEEAQPVFETEGATDEAEILDEEVEIEVDFDDAVDIEIPLHEEATIEPEEDWLSSVGKMLDKIATKTGKVKFASDLDGEDAQSHYDLGTAFMEMGLYDESFKEFRQAAVDANRRFVCFVFQGVCLREKGDLENAEKVLRSLVRPGLSLEDSCSAKYELALTCEAGGKPDEYVKLLIEIAAEDRNFRDVSRRLDAVNTDKDALDFSDDDFKIFDVK
ncbi:MAG: tetratricopeptide repeat protein [Geobacteraceae bacterium]|nr:tetratricopeptide repeat protein [Geobacteraceae bacterium]